MIAALLAAALLAQAAPDPAAAPAPELAAAPAPPDDVDALIEQAAREYDQSQFAEALKTLERAYAASPRTAILFNMAQVQRAQGDCAAARASYSRFLAETPPDDPNRERAERRHAEMQGCLDRLAPKPAAPAQPSKTPTALQRATPAPPAMVVTPAAVVPPPAPQRWRPRAGAAAWVLAGVGTLAAGTAAFLAWEAKKDSDELSNSSPHHWNPALDSEGRRDALWARWLGVGAAVTGGSSLTLFLITRHHADPGVPAPPRQTAALIGWSTDF